MAWDRRVDDGTKALSAEVVDDAQHPETVLPTITDGAPLV